MHLKLKMFSNSTRSLYSNKTAANEEGFEGKLSYQVNSPEINLSPSATAAKLSFQESMLYQSKQRNFFHEKTAAPKAHLEMEVFHEDPEMYFSSSEDDLVSCLGGAGALEISLLSRIDELEEKIQRNV